MIFKKIGIILFLIFSLLPINKIFAQVSNTGFVSSSIWYSKDSFEEGDKIKIYTFVFNPDSRELSGTVIFFDKTILLGKKDFLISGKGADDISIDWTVTAGDHNIFAKIENAKFLISKGKYEEVYLAENETEKSSLSISKKINSNTTTEEPNSSITDNLGSTSISDIKKVIEEKTPDFITEPVISATNILEKFRLNTSIAGEAKKEEVKKEIKTLSVAPIKSNKKTISNQILKPFKYVELFFLSIFLFILDSKILFYGILIFFLFFVLRFVWNKIFDR